MTTTDETQIEAQLTEAWDLLEQGDVAAAVKIAEQLHTTAADVPDVPLLLATCARVQGDEDRTLRLLREAIALDPDWAEPELRLADMLAADPDRQEEALRHASLALKKAEEEDEVLDALAMKAGLELQLDKLEAARTTLANLPPVKTADAPPAVAHEIGHLLLALDELVLAEQWLSHVTTTHPDFADGWHGLGLVAEALGDETRKRDAWLRVLQLETEDDAASEDDDRLTEAELATEAEAALAELPPRARALLENVPIIIADRPSREDVSTGLDPRLLGLFAGTPHPEVSSVGGVPQLTQILLFRRNLEAVTEDEQELRDEIRTTLLHETGHFFGMSEDDLERVGLE